MKPHLTTVLFADIVGSTTLFEKLGDETAASYVNQCLKELAQVTLEYNGQVVKTIGDAIMATFPLPDAAIDAACHMQEKAKAITNPLGETMSLRVGAHYGNVLETEGDVVGDAVNVASRLTNLARAAKILTTQETVNLLPQAFRQKIRPFDKVALKGKQDETVIFEVIWEASDITITSIPITAARPEESALTLGYRDHNAILRPGPASFWIGRHSSCGLIVGTSMTSRFHAKIEHHRGKFILTDESTNGTYIELDGMQYYLRRESFPIIGAGRISLGEKIRNDDPDVITFSVTQATGV